jgi:hypothetical protein
MARRLSQARRQFAAQPARAARNQNACHVFSFRKVLGLIRLWQDYDSQI